jgi:lantibiotic modifying enzyme
MLDTKVFDKLLFQMTLSSSVRLAQKCFSFRFSAFEQAFMTSKQASTFYRRYPILKAQLISGA